MLFLLGGAFINEPTLNVFKIVRFDFEFVSNHCQTRAYLFKLEDILEDPWSLWSSMFIYLRPHLIKHSRSKNQTFRNKFKLFSRRFFHFFLEFSALFHSKVYVVVNRVWQTLINHKKNNSKDSSITHFIQNMIRYHKKNSLTYPSFQTL